MKRPAEEVCRKFLDRAKEGLSSRAIAQLYNIYRPTVSRIIKNADDDISP
jgi:DNA-binding transcriptional regulator LsrR (DeoR family)